MVPLVRQLAERPSLPSMLTHEASPAHDTSASWPVPHVCLANGGLVEGAVPGESVARLRRTIHPVRRTQITRLGN